MGKQFAINLNNVDLGKLFTYLRKQGFLIYKDTKIEEVNIDNETQYIKDIFESFCIAKTIVPQIQPYDTEYQRFFSPSFYPVIEFSKYRFWIDSRAKGLPIWDDFDLIKRWVKNNFYYDGHGYVSCPSKGTNNNKPKRKERF
jgi:hypothetical protein